MTEVNARFRRLRARFVRPFHLIVLAACVVAIAPSYVGAYTLTPGGVSEVPTILGGDTIIVNRAAYDLRLPYSNIVLLRTWTPRRGDMVFIRVPTREAVAPKRLIALPGDTIEVRENAVFVNERALFMKALNRADFAWVPRDGKIGLSVADENGYQITYTRGAGAHRNHPATRLSSDQYFLLGDNRDASEDSRTWGPLSRNQILGRVVMILPTGPREPVTR